ncbi:MAG: hypothetical protein CSA09_02530 [Candidatus Contendobacter odensis]|uniref:Uncharacterized protein n=1 Tax=Candidatus Contendibacter odensensis TaxID=1400860 RepID=A0A2G6PFM5_9GAMM|nr:MAG: hypothetical protein CSA09_02530 [Candidatus Contendobacter odensis]
MATYYAKNTASFLAVVHIRCIGLWRKKLTTLFSKQGNRKPWWQVGAFRQGIRCADKAMNR